jgi:hypothetical protein
MKSVWIVVLGGSALTLALSAPRTAYRVASGDDKAPVASGAATTFVGADECKKCHFKQWKTWKETKMAHAFDLLKPGQATDAKKKIKLDPATDYTKEERCVRCHTTGYGEPNGYPKVDAVAANAPLADARKGVQCEDCHGAGSRHAAYMTAHPKDHDASAEKQLGVVLPDAASCLACHHGGTDGSPSLPAGTVFDAAAKMKVDGAIHEHLKK